MSLGTDILQAVKSGGMNNWRPACEARQSERVMHKRQTRTEQNADLIYEAMGSEVWTVDKLCKVPKLVEVLGTRQHTYRDYLHRLVNDGRVKKSQAYQPHKFWRVDSST